MKRRLCSFLLVLTMLLSMLPHAALAAGEPTFEDFFTVLDGVAEASNDAAYPFTVDSETADGPWLKSGNAGKSSSEGTITLTFTKAATLTFDWEVSSEARYDGLLVKNDGDEVYRWTDDGCSGNNPNGSGAARVNADAGSTVTIAYRKDSGGDQGDDCLRLKNFQITLPNQVVFHANNGTDETKTQGIFGTSALDKNTFTYDGYTFQGWAESADAETADYADQASITLDGADKELYAVWAPVYHLSFTVTPEQAEFTLYSGEAHSEILSPNGDTGYTYTLENGTYAWEASCFGYQTAAGSVEVNGGDVEQAVALTAYPAYTVTFTFDPPADSADISGRSLDVKTGDRVMAAEDADGLVYSLPVGYHYTWSFKSSSHAKQSGSIDLTGETETGTQTVAIPLTVKTAWEGADDIAEPQLVDGVYQIGSGSELAWLAQEVNGRRGTSYDAVLTGDIDLGGEEWTPIGQAYATRYAGTFDGQGYTVMDLKVTGSASGNYGLFGYVEGGTVQNLTVEGEIHVTGSGGSSYGIAGVVGQFNGTDGAIQNCINKAAVNGSQNVGGVIGYITGGYSAGSKAVRACANLGGVVSTGNKAGGVVGYINGPVTVDSCYNRGTVKGGGWYSGGITSYLSSSYALLQNCYTTGAVETGSGAYPAIGNKNSGTVSNVYYLDTLGTDANAAAKTADELKSLAPTLGEAFMAAPGGRNDGYPILTFQVPTCEAAFTVNDAGAVVRIEGMTGTSAVSGDSVVWTFRLPDGDYTYTVSAFGKVSQSGGLTVSGAAVSKDITLAEAETKNVTFAVTPQEAAAIAAITVTWNGETVPANEDGSYTLPYGDYHYLVKAKGYAKEAAGFTVSAGSEAAISVSLTASAAWDGETLEPVTPNAGSIYEISSGEELAWFAGQVNSGAVKNAHAVLTDDIDLGGEGWTPIGNSSNAFAGVFDGGGYTVSGLMVSDVPYAGLFGCAKGAGDQNAVIQNVVVQGTVSATADAGGIVGRADDTTIQNCGGEVQVTGGDNAGGIVGKQHTYGCPVTVERCYNTGSVNGVSRVGGIIGSVNDEAAITSCYNTGAVTSGGYAGGMRGSSGSYAGNTENCYNAGTVTGSPAGPILSGSGAATGCYYLDAGQEDKTGSTAKTAGELKNLTNTLNGGTSPAVWKSAPGVNGDYPILAWQKVSAQTGGLGLAENVEFGREDFALPGSEPVSLPTGQLTWDAVENAAGYGISLWQRKPVWTDLSGEELEAFYRAEPADKLMMIDEDALIEALSADQKTALAPLDQALKESQALLEQAGGIEEYEAAAERYAAARANRAAYLAEAIAGGNLPLGYYTSEAVCVSTISDVTGTSYDCGADLAALPEGVYYAAVSAKDEAGGYTLPTGEQVEETLFGLQDPYNRMQPVTGLAWDGTTAKWDGKSGFTAAQFYSIDLYTVTETPGGDTYTFVSSFSVGGNHTSANLGNVFTAETRYAFKIWAVPDEDFQIRSGRTVSLDSGYSPVYVPAGRPAERDWVEISTAEEWVALANEQDIPSGGTDSPSQQSVAWSKNYRLTADLDFSGLSAADQAKTKSIGNVTNRFLGELDGNGHKITGLTLSNYDAGLFAYIGATGYVHDLTIVGANVLFSDNAAVLAHNNYGVISDCAVINCNITADTGAVLGGMVSRNYGVIRSSYVQGGTLTSNSLSATGHAGFVGANEAGGRIESCWTSMDVNTQSDYAGGFVGLGYGGSIQNCFALGRVSARSYSGGFAGRSVFDGNLYENCYAAGVVTVTGEAGRGFIGGSKPDSAFQPDLSQEIVNCYYNSVSPADAYAAGKSLAEMKTEAFAHALGSLSWTWSADENDGLPYLIGVPAPESLPTADITVTVALAVYDKGSYAFSPMGQPVEITMASSGNARVVDLMDAAVSQGKLTYSYETTPSFGRYIHAINGYEVEKPDGWMFTINDQISSVSASLATVTDGDRLLWYEGTTENRYQGPAWADLSGTDIQWVDISTVEDLKALEESTDGEALAKNYRLTADLDLTGVSFSGIGAAEYPFTGVFDGQNHTVSNVTITGADNVGFFGVIKGATVKNLILTGVACSGSTNVGGLAGRAEAALDKSDMTKSVANLIGSCTVSGTVSGAAQVGGLVGLNGGDYDKDTQFSISSAIDKCRADVAVTAAGSGSGIGGLVGKNDGVITKSASAGDVKASDATVVGGFVGDSYGDIYDSHAGGNVTGESTVGGVAGASSGTVRNCYSLGSVSGQSNTGGFAGSISAAEYVVSAGPVTVTGSSSTGYNGGFAGRMGGTIAGISNQITIKDAYGNCAQPDGAAPLNPIGNMTQYSSESEAQILAQMKLDTTAATSARLYEMFGVNMSVPDGLTAEAAKYADAVTISSETPVDTPVSLLKQGETAADGITVRYEVENSEYLTGGSGLTLKKTGDAATPLAVRVTVVLTDGSGNTYRKAVTVRLPAAPGKVDDLMDAIAASYTGSSDGWTVMDMAVYGTLADKTSQTAGEARQNALNLLIAEAAEAGTGVSDRARIEIVLRAMGVDSTRLYGANSSTALSNPALLSKLNLTSGGYYAAPWLLLADLQGNLKLSDKQIDALIGLLNDNIGGGLFGYEYNGVTYSDPDTAGAALAALARFYDSNRTAASVVDRILAALPAAMNPDGSFGSANSDAMVILGLLALGRSPYAMVNPATGASVADGLLSYVNPATNQFQFAGADNALATEQGFRALVALAKFDGTHAYNFYDFRANSVEPGRATGAGVVDPVPTPPDTAGNITVSFTLKTDTETWIPKTDVTVKEGSTVYHAFIEALSGSGITQSGAEKGYVKSITRKGVTVAEFSKGQNSGWLYQVNGNLPNVGLTSYKLQAGDDILFYYTTDWTKDSEAGGSFHSGAAADKAAANAVSDLIEAIGTVTKDSGPKIEAARDAYDALTAAQKELVDNYRILTNAEAAFARLNGAWPFTDVDGHWALDAIRYVYENELMNGVDGQRFEPDGTLNRAMLVTILHRMEGEPASASERPFTDVPDGAWYAGAVIWAAEKGMVNGYGDGRFGPADHITREQLAAILMRYAKYKGYDVSKANDLSSYADAGQIGGWALPAMRWANAEGLIMGCGGGAINPNGPVTRGEAATILMRFMQNLVK